MFIFIAVDSGGQKVVVEAVLVLTLKHTFVPLQILQKQPGFSLQGN